MEFASGVDIEKAVRRLPRIAVIIPCLNEAQTIGRVVADWRRELPEAEVWVIDNDSDDNTAQVALEHGARVLTETRRGKGFAVRTAFRSIDAEIYVMVDGDDTYPAEAVHDLLPPALARRADMVVGSRTMEGTDSQFNAVNRLGNRIYAGLVRFLLRVRLTDILSGLRVMTRDLVRTVPIAASGFEIEAELTVKTIERNLRILELPINLRSRPHGSTSKIRIFRDGARIAWTILLLFRDYKPLTFFGGLGLLFVLAGLYLGIGIAIEYADTGLVARLPTAILAGVFEIVGIVLGAVGMVLSSVSKRFQEIESKLDLISQEGNASKEIDPIKRRTGRREAD